MKETMQQHLHTVGQKAIQNVIRHEYGDWPPKSGGPPCWPLTRTAMW